MRTASPLLAGALWALALSVTGAPGARADGPAAPPPPPSVSDLARKESIERLEKDLRRMANSPRAPEKKDEILKDLEALGALGGADAAKAGLEALALDNEAVEKAAIGLVETAHAKSLVAPLAALIEHKDFRRRFRLQVLVAHALSVIADVTALEPLVVLVQSENPNVVAAAGDAFVVFKSAPHTKRVEPVKRCLEVFESTWNLKESHRPEDRVATDQAKTQWEVYGASLRRALQALTGQTQLTKPRQFRDWWNDHKKESTW